MGYRKLRVIAESTDARAISFLRFAGNGDKGDIKMENSIPILERGGGTNVN